MSSNSTVSWSEGGRVCSARWRAENGAPAPSRIVVSDDGMRADTAYRLALSGTGLLWRGDFQNGRQLLAAIERRLDRKPRRSVSAPKEAFHLYRQEQARRASVLGRVLVPVEQGYVVPLRRAPDVRHACLDAYGSAAEPFVTSLRELLGVVGAHEWRRNGVSIPALGARIHPHYGVFSPVRGEYVDLVANEPLGTKKLAFDIGTGTGVLAAVLIGRGVERVVATDTDPRALSCAKENLDRLGIGGKVEVVRADLFPPGRAPLIVCNPPWIPARPSSPIERAVYDPGSRMLRGFLDRLSRHLEPGGEGWLILSDLAEHLGLRVRAEVLSAIDAAGLRVSGRSDITPVHPKAFDRTDPLHAARAAEVTSLWRLSVR